VIEKTDSRIQTFQSRADPAAFWEAWVAAVLKRRGLYVVQHPFQTTEELGKPAEHWAHTWDLDVAIDWPDAPATYWARLPAEVKSQSLQFLKPRDYPERDDAGKGMLVCSQNSWVKKWGHKNHVQRDFLFVSMRSGAVLWLPTGSPVTLGVKTVDRTRNEHYLTVRTSPSLLRTVDEYVASVRERLS
jgi:hypothetical protein